MSTTSPPTPLRSPLPLPLSPRVEHRRRQTDRTPTPAASLTYPVSVSPANPPSTPNNNSSSSATHTHTHSHSQRHIRAPSNIARLQSHSHIAQSSKITTTSSSTSSKIAVASGPTVRSGLKPLNMSSLNLPPPPSSPSTSTAASYTLRSKSLTTEEKDRRRRSMIVPPSLRTTLPDVDLEITPSGRKLKRLSLCAGGTGSSSSSVGDPLNPGSFRSPSLELDRSSSDRSNSTLIPAPSPPLPVPSSPMRPSTPASINASGGEGHHSNSTARRPDRRIGVRASISYSPAPPQIVHTPRTGERRSYEDDWEVRMGLGEGYDLTEPEREFSEGDEEDSDSVEGAVRVKAGGQTLTEKHADLLTLIAQRERRVNELKQELRQQEASLHNLKSRWTSIVSRSALSPTSLSNSNSSDTRRSSYPHSQAHSHAHAHSQTHTPVPSRRARPASMISTSTSSASSVSLATIDEPTAAAGAIAIPNALILPTGGLSSTGAAVLSGIMAQTEGYLGPEVVEGGKRFLGTLWRTVGAAAGGTVPEQDQRDHYRGSVRDVGATGSRFMNISGNRNESEEEENEKRSIAGETSERDNAVQETNRTVGDHGVSGGEEWTQFGPKLDLSNLQRMITPWTTPTPTSPSSGLTSTPTSMSSSSSRPPQDFRSTMKRERYNGNSNQNHRSNTVTPTSYYANRIAGSPKMQGMGISAGRMMPPLSPSRSRIDLPEAQIESGTDTDRTSGLGGKDVESIASGFDIPLTTRGNGTGKAHNDSESRGIAVRAVNVQPSGRSGSGRGSASTNAEGDSDGEGWGW
ncbi:hypothetical protein IAU59_005495 [Kwoniella sp. CBS 9459]